MSPSPDISLKSVPVDWSCDRCHAHLRTTSLSNLLDHPNLLASPSLCAICLTHVSDELMLEKWVERQKGRDGSRQERRRARRQQWWDEEDRGTWQDIVGPVVGFVLLGVIFLSVYAWVMP